MKNALPVRYYSQDDATKAAIIAKLDYGVKPKVRVNLHTAQNTKHNYPAATHIPGWHINCDWYTVSTGHEVNRVYNRKTNNGTINTAVFTVDTVK